MTLQDLITGTKFWVPIALSLLPVVLAATAITIYTPRLTVEVSISGGPLFSLDFGKTYSREEVLGSLDKALRASLQAQGDKVFDPKGNAARIAEYDKTTPIDKQVEKLNLFLPYVRVPLSIKAGNIGLLASTVNSISVFFVEEVDGRRSPISAISAKLSVKLGQGEIVVLDGPLVEQCCTIPSAGGALFMNYEIVRSLKSKTGSLQDHDRYFESMADFYGNILPLAKALGRISSKSHVSKIIAVVYIADIYGRQAGDELIIYDSRLP